MAAQPSLSNFELMVMLAIIRIGDGAYGVSISDEIEETIGSEVLLGSVYDALGRLAEKGLIASELGEATAERGGRAKRHFRATTRGLQLVRETQRSLIKLWKGLPQLKVGEA
jgi:PadR family transcriptional regulator, regulatory protein PadR